MRLKPVTVKSTAGHERQAADQQQDLDGVAGVEAQRRGAGDQRRTVHSTQALDQAEAGSAGMPHRIDGDALGRAPRRARLVPVRSAGARRRERRRGRARAGRPRAPPPRCSGGSARRRARRCRAARSRCRRARGAPSAPSRACSAATLARPRARTTCGLAAGLDLAQDPGEPPDHGDHDRQADDRAHDAGAAAARGVRRAGAEP